MTTGLCAARTNLQSAIATLGANVRARRHELGWSSSKLASEALIAGSVVEGIENRDEKAFAALDLAAFYRLAAAMDLDPNLLLKADE